MNVPRDKVVHAVGGFIVALFAGLAAVVLLRFGLGPVPTAVVVGTVTAAISVEVAQYAANRAAVNARFAPVHDVSILDAAASTAPGLVVALVLFVFGT